MTSLICLCPISYGRRFIFVIPTPELSYLFELGEKEKKKKNFLFLQENIIFFFNFRKGWEGVNIATFDGSENELDNGERPLKPIASRCGG